MPHQDIYRNGQRLVSATELMGILAKPFLDKWRKSLCECRQCNPAGDGICGFIKGDLVGKEAAEFGNKIHLDVENFLKTGDESSTEPWSLKVIEKLKELKVQKYLIEPEETLIDDESGLAGSPDFICKILGEPSIGDLKVKNSLDPLTALQGCTYRYLVRRKFGVDIRNMDVIWACKKTKTMMVKRETLDLDKWTDCWLAMITMWNHINPKRAVTIYSSAAQEAA